MCPFLQAAIRKRNVGCDHNVVRLHVLDNPIIGRIECILHNFECNPLLIWNSHPGVGHQGDVEVIPACDTIDLLFDRARIGINIDMQQTKNLTITPDPVGTLSHDLGRYLSISQRFLDQVRHSHVHQVKITYFLGTFRPANRLRLALGGAYCAKNEHAKLCIWSNGSARIALEVQDQNIFKLDIAKISDQPAELGRFPIFARNKILTTWKSPFSRGGLM